MTPFWGLLYLFLFRKWSKWLSCIFILWSLTCFFFLIIYRNIMTHYWLLILQCSLTVQGKVMCTFVKNLVFLVCFWCEEVMGCFVLFWIICLLLLKWFTLIYIYIYIYFFCSTMNDIVDKFNTAYDRHSRRGGRTAFIWMLLTWWLFWGALFFLCIAHNRCLGVMVGRGCERNKYEN